MAEPPQQTILVIDDEQVILNLLVNWLSAAGFRVIPAHNGEEGIALFRRQPFDLVLTDLVMANIDGLQVLATINREAPGLPVIIISGAGSLDDSIKALRLGAWDYLSKPIDRALLTHQIGKALERAELLKENTRYRQHLQAEVERRTAQLSQRTAELEQANFNLHEEIEARQQVEQRLQEANERWQTTFDSMPDFISIHDTDYTILKANKALAQFLGHPPEDLIGKKCFQLFHKSCAPWPSCPHCELLATGQPQTSEVIDPQLGIPLLITVSPLTSEGKIIGSIHVARDISHQKRLEEERQKSLNLESIAVLCGGLAHDFNNLLTALIGYIDLAKMEKSPDMLPHWLDHAKMVTNLATELTRQLLTFSKGGSPILNPVSVAILIKDSLDQFLNSFPQVRPEIYIDHDIWPLNGDQSQLRIVIKNIVYNAAEAMPNGGTVTIEAHNIPQQQVSSGDEDAAHPPLACDSVRLSFTDQGAGIDPAILNKIFDPYFTTSAKGAAKGKGMGLALCHSIISKHHGHISVSSKKDQGTTVSIYLPAASASQGRGLTTDDDSR